MHWEGDMKLEILFRSAILTGLLSAAGAWAQDQMPAPLYDPNNLPLVEGHAEQGGTLYCNAGVALFADDAVFEWIVNDSPAGAGEVLPGAEGQLLDLNGQHVGRYVACRATLANAGGSLSETSPFIGPVAPLDPRAAVLNLAPPVVRYQPLAVGRVAECTRGVWDRYDACFDVQHRWISRGSPSDAGQVFSSYPSIDVQQRHLGKYLSCEVRIKDVCNQRESAWARSDTAGPVTEQPPLIAEKTTAICSAKSCTITIAPDVKEYIAFHATLYARNVRFFRRYWIAPGSAGEAVITLPKLKQGRYDLQVYAFFSDVRPTDTLSLRLKKGRGGRIRVKQL